MFTHIYIYQYMKIFIHICTNLSIFTYTLAYFNTMCTYVYLQIYEYIYLYVKIFIHISPPSDEYIYQYMKIFIHVQIYQFVHVRIH
jgi:hypothetical protein